MAIPSEKLAQSLDVLRQLQESKSSPDLAGGSKICRNLNIDASIVLGV